MIRVVKIVPLFLLLVHGMCQKDGAAEVWSSDEISGNVKLKLLKNFVTAFGLSTLTKN